MAESGSPALKGAPIYLPVKAILPRSSRPRTPPRRTRYLAGASPTVWTAHLLPLGTRPQDVNLVLDCLSMGLEPCECTLYVYEGDPKYESLA